jgi:uncharacterized membrane protein YeaQ/YmgE (transglycosylase-associated protein family)
MEWIVAIVVGGLVGWMAHALFGGRAGALVPSVLLGVVGAVLGDWIAGALGLAAAGSPARWLLSAVAAGLLIGVVRALGGLRRPLRSA